MRNLKRALSLGLTAAMISGLMVMGSSAASYADVTSEDNQEAIEVLQAVGIMVGDEKGNFNPDQQVTRNEMAVVMSNLMAYNVATYKNTSPFTDVPSWAEPYVAACYTNGITAGYSDTIYGGNDTVTTAQAALMVMKALGYFQYSSDFGNDWQLSTVSQGNKIDLFEDVDSGVREAMTRNDVAQLVLNALEAGTVEAETNGSISVGDITIVNDVKYNFVTSNRDYAYAISDKIPTSSTSATVGPIVELGEKLYQGDLTKDEDRDDFGRPANIWEYQAKEVGTFEDEADYTFTAKVTSKALYNEVGKTASENYTWSVYVNGDRVDDFSRNDLVKYKADDDADFNAKQGGNKLTGNGVITEIFVDGTHETVTVAVMNQYAAEVLKVYEDDGTITLSDLAEDGPVDAKDTFEATDFAEDDIVIYTYANDKIQSVYAAERVEGDVTSVRVNSKTNSDGSFVEKDDGDNFVVDGTTYKYNATMKTSEMLDTDNVNNGVVAYVDAQGYVAYIDESAVTYDYAYVLSMGTDEDQFGGGEAGKTVYARLVLTDGTMVKAETDVKATDMDKYENHIVSYSKDKNDVYSLTERSGGFELADATKLDINNGKAGMTLVDDADKGKTSAVANADTLFIVADSDDDMDDYDFTVYSGVKNVPDIDGISTTEAVVALKEGSNVAKVVYIEDADVSGAGQVVFAKADKTPKYTKNQDGKIFEIDAIVDGEATTLLVKEGSTAAKRLVTFGSFPTGTAIKLNDDEYLVALKGVTENADGYVTSVRLYDDVAEVKSGTGMEKSKNDIVTLTGNGSWTWTDDVVVAQFNDKNNKGEFESSKMSSIKDDENDKYLAILDDGVIIGLLTQYVENDGDEDDVIIDTDVKVNVANGKITLSNALFAGTDEKAAAIVAELNRLGYSDVKVNVSDGKITGATATKDSIEYTFTSVEDDQTGSTTIDKDTTATILGAKITATSDVAVTVTDDGKVRIESGKATVSDGDNIVVEGGTVTVTGENTEVTATGGTVNISAGTVTAFGGVTVNASDNAKVKVGKDSTVTVAYDDVQITVHNASDSKVNVVKDGGFNSAITSPASGDVWEYENSQWHKVEPTT